MNLRNQSWFVFVALYGAVGVSSSVRADHILPAIQHGNIAVVLSPIATGMAAPLYGINPPGDMDRLFVLEQNGLVRIIQNGSLLPA